MLKRNVNQHKTTMVKKEIFSTITFISVGFYHRAVGFYRFSDIQRKDHSCSIIDDLHAKNVEIFLRFQFDQISWKKKVMVKMLITIVLTDLETVCKFVIFIDLSFDGDPFN